MGDDIKLKFLNDIFKESIDASKASRIEAMQSFEYERGNQLPEDVKSELENRGQPVRWENIYKKIGNKLAGMKSMSKQEITPFPRRLKDREVADIIAKLLHSFQDSNEWWANKNRADKDLRLAGLSVIEARVKILNECDSVGKKLTEVEYIHLPVLECFPDMYSKAPDASDARYFHHSRLYHIPGLKRKFGDKIKGITANKANMARVTRTWYRDENTNEIRHAIWTHNVLLEDKPLAYNKLNRFPLAIRKLGYGAFKEYCGMFRDIRPFQDSINNMMLRIINMLGSSKLIIESDAVDDIDVFTRHYELDNSVSEVRAGGATKIKDISQNAPIAQLMNMVQDARLQAEQVIGLNSELLGSAINRLSGYAIENRQNAGLVGLQEYMDSSEALDIDIAEISIKMIEQYFTAEQVLLITDKANNKIPLTINEYERLSNGKIKEKNGLPVQKSIISTGRYDLILQRVPFNRGASGERQKNWTEIIKTLQVTNPRYIAPLLPVMLRDVDSPEAEETARILEKLEKEEKENQQQNPQQNTQQEMMMLEIEKMKAQITELNSKAQLNQSKAANATTKEEKPKNSILDE